MNTYIRLKNRKKIKITDFTEIIFVESLNIM